MGLRRVVFFMTALSEKCLTFSVLKISNAVASLLGALYDDCDFRRYLVPIHSRSIFKLTENSQFQKNRPRKLTDNSRRARSVLF